MGKGVTFGLMLLAAAVTVAVVPAVAGSARRVTSKPLPYAWGVGTTHTQFVCAQCGDGGTPMTLDNCSYELYIQFPDVKGAKDYEIVVQDKDPRVNQTYDLHAPPFQDHKDGYDAPAGTHRFVGFTGGSGAGPCPPFSQYASRFKVLKSVVGCLSASCTVPKLKPLPEFSPTGLPPLPQEPGAGDARVLSIQKRDPNNGALPIVIVTRDGKQYSASEKTVVKAGDQLTTRNNTVMSFEFLDGGRVGVNSDTTIEVGTGRNTQVVSGGKRETVLSAGQLWVAAAGKKGPPQPLEIQTNGGTLGIRDTGK